MALAEVQHIMEILKTAHQQKMQEKELQQRQQEQESQAVNRLAVRDEADRAFQQHVKDQEAAQKIHQQAADLQMKMYKLQGSKALQEMGESYQKSGVAPGGQVAPMGSGPTGDFSPVDQTKATGAQITIPGMEDLGPIQVATPLVAAQKEAERSRITMAPAEEAKTREAVALTQARSQADQASDERDFRRAAAMKIYDDDRADKKLKADAELARLQRASMERIAAINHPTETGLDLSPIADDLIQGKNSLEGLNKLSLSKLDRTKLINAVTGSGARILNQKQMDLVDDYPQIIGAIPFMDEIIRQQPQSTNYLSSKLGGAVSTFDTSLRGVEKELDARASVVARFLREKGNLSNQDINRVMGMFPSRFDTVEVNTKKRNDFVKELGKIVDAKLDNLSPAQRNVIKKRIGLLDVGMYGGGGKQQATPASSPQILKYDSQGNLISAGGR